MDCRRSTIARRFGIQLRRFAGPLSYQKTISHLRVAHLTDLHVGRITPFAVQKAAVEMANAEKPDLVVLTGDFVCHSQLYLDQLVEVVSGFSAPTWRCWGTTITGRAPTRSSAPCGGAAWRSCRTDTPP